MDTVERIRTAFERNARAVTLRPAIGQGTAVTRVRIRCGLTCDIEDGRWTFTADMSEKSGGESQGPDPGVYGRAALGSCLAVGYAMWAAKRGVPLAALEIEIQADYDVRGELGVGDIEPGYTEIRYLVSVETEASEDDILSLVDEADASSPYLHVFSRPQKLHREVRVSAPRR
jgi:uncharacterized OsmC-like protein